MYDDDRDALAAEYVLGTLSADERSQAERMIGVDQGFVEIVRQWERRLGELNVMVEAVEPPAKIWDGVQSGIGPLSQNEAAASEPLGPILAGAKSIFEVEPEPAEKSEDGKPASPDAPAADERSPEAETPSEGDKDPAEPIASSSAPFVLLPPLPAVPPETARSADVSFLLRRARRWRGVALGCGALAVALLALIVALQVKPGLIPSGGFHLPRLIAESAPSRTAIAAPPASQWVAVLQQDPSVPAFLLTIDPAARTMTVRAVAAKAATDHSFELWLMRPPASTALSLGLIGGAEYTQRPLPAGLDAAALQAATYAVSYEPAGGSKTGAPSGPILFTGRLVQSLPAPSPPPPKT